MKKLLANLLCSLLCIPIQAMYFAGTANPAGSSAESAVSMTQDGCTYIWYGTLKEGTLQFLTHKSADTKRYTPTSASKSVTLNQVMPVQLEASTSTNIFNFKAGVYTLSLDTIYNTLTVIGTVDQTLDPEYPLTGLMIVGLFSSWTPQDMEEIGTGQFKYTGQFGANEDFKFRYAEDWWPGFVATGQGYQELHQNETLKMKYYKTQPADSDDNKWYFSTSGEKTVYVDLKKLTVSTIVPTDATETDNSNSTVIYTNNRKITISNGTYGCEYTLINITGAVIAEGEIESENTVLYVQNTGLYILRIGNDTYKTIVY